MSRLFKFCGLAATLLLLQITSHSIEYTHGYAFLSKPKYDPEFEYFDYVNPDAPKGGIIRIPQMGNWDSFNPIPPRGRVAAGLSVGSPTDNLLLNSLVDFSADETTSIYGVIADGIAVADDMAWVAFRIRQDPKPRWHDGRPITVEDLEFSFDVYRNLANPSIQNPILAFTEIEVINEREVRYHILESERTNPLLPIRIGTLPVLPKHYWESKDITKTTVEPPLGSGPYKVGEFYVGQWVIYERVEDYWGADLPINRGRFNFDQIKFDYFRDDQVQTESLKGNIVDVHVENIPRLWETGLRLHSISPRSVQEELCATNSTCRAVVANLLEPRSAQVPGCASSRSAVDAQ